MKLIEFDVFDSKSTGKISIDPDRVEMIVDLENLGEIGATQINMRSGAKFFVKSIYSVVKQRIVNKE